jgi:SAM-dependent methyltransferase
MKKILRTDYVDSYWDQRWRAAGVDQEVFKNLDIYPVKYSEQIAQESTSILEAGCGTGRLYFHYRNQGKDIEGLEYSHVAVDLIKKIDPSADIIQGSITELPYEDARFDAVLAFGLYHSIEDEKAIQKAFLETARVLKQGGKLVFSVRLDNLENRLLENIFRRRSNGKTFDQFHKWQFSEKDIEKLLKDAGMIWERAFYARNVSFLFKFDFFRSKHLKKNAFDESQARSGGFKLNKAGAFLDRILHSCFPKNFSNVIVVIAQKL